MNATLYIAQPGYENILCEELIWRLGPRISENIKTQAGSGFLVLQNTPPPCMARPLIFERQRMENALFVQTGSVKATARAILRDVMPAITKSGNPWRAHAFAPALQGNRHLALRAASVAAALHDLLRKGFPAVFRRLRRDDKQPSQNDLASSDVYNEYVLQICATPDGCWAASTPALRLSSPFPGGIHRMRFDANAPSRSFLKIEEVFSLMSETPQQGQTVVDLGAAPGGWSYAFIKRGCRVTAIDNGPLKIAIKNLHNAQIRHLRQDGISFEPRGMQLPLDWLAADMLIPPGKALGLLKRWLLSGRTKRFIVNIKLPQLHPIAAIKPIEELLAGSSGIAFQLRHLYHDRREVTAFGRIHRNFPIRPC